MASRRLDGSPSCFVQSRRPAPQHRDEPRERSGLCSKHYRAMPWPWHAPLPQARRNWHRRCRTLEASGHFHHHRLRRSQVIQPARTPKRPRRPVAQRRWVETSALNTLYALGGRGLVSPSAALRREGVPTCRPHFCKPDQVSVQTVPTMIPRRQTCVNRACMPREVKEGEAKLFRFASHVSVRARRPPIVRTVQGQVPYRRQCIFRGPPDAQSGNGHRQSLAPKNYQRPSLSDRGTDGGHGRRVNAC